MARAVRLGELTPRSGAHRGAFGSRGVGLARERRLVSARPPPASTLPGSPILAACRRRLRLTMALLSQAEGRPEERDRIRARAVAELTAVRREQDDFVRATAHDLMHGLAVIRGRAQLIQRRAPRAAPSEVASGLDQVVATVDDLTLVVAGLIAEVERPGDASEGEPAPDAESRGA